MKGRISIITLLLTFGAQAQTYYSQGTLYITSGSNWNTARDGTGDFGYSTTYANPDHDLIVTGHEFYYNNREEPYGEFNGNSYLFETGTTLRQRDSGAFSYGTFNGGDITVDAGATVTILNATAAGVGNSSGGINGTANLNLAEGSTLVLDNSASTSSGDFDFALNVVGGGLIDLDYANANCNWYFTGLSGDFTGEIRGDTFNGMMALAAGDGAINATVKLGRSAQDRTGKLDMNGEFSIGELLIDAVTVAEGVYTYADLVAFGTANGADFSNNLIDNGGTIYVGQPSDSGTITTEWINILEQKMIDRHTGGGAYAITSGTTGYSEYADAVADAQAQAASALSNYTSYNIVTNSSGEVTGGNALGDITQTLMLDLYGLGLALHMSPGPESTAKARAFVKWLQWAGLTEENMAWTYIGAFGRAAFLVHSVLDAADQEYLRGIMFGSPGDRKLEELLVIAESGLFNDNIGTRGADELRQISGALLPAILMLPDGTPEEQQAKLNDLSRARNAIVFGATPISGVRGFLKPDHTGSHHLYHYTSAYVPQAAAALASMAEFFQGSPWQLSDAELEAIQGYAGELFFYAHFDHVPNTLSGRMFADDVMLSQSYHVLPLAAMAGSTPDDELLQVLVNTYRSDMGGLDYAPCYRLNQRGYPGYLATLAKARQVAEQQAISSAFINGVRSYPYSPALAKRKNNWMAFVRGMSKWWWTYEGGITATNPQAYYGIYKSHGALELRYIDPAAPLNGATANPLTRQGMDMSHIPGATTPIRTDEEMINDAIVSRLRINSTSVGGVELDQEHGLFMFDLKNCPTEMKDPGFEARKSYFFLGDRIIMLGDNIRSQSPNNYPVHTTLFQNFLNQADRSQSPIQVNSSMAVTADTYTYSQPNLTNSHVLVDADGTGYYIPPGQHLHVERRNSAWRQTITLTAPSTDIPARQAEALAKPDETAYRAFAWFDHGANPSGVGYEYVVLPGTDYDAADSFRQQQDLGLVYEVRQKSAQAHIVHDLENDLWAYALYDDYASSNNGPLLAVNIETALPHEDETVDANPGYAVMLDESAPNSMKLAVSYLDLRMHGDYNPTYGFDVPGTNSERYDYGSAPVQLKVVLDGLWSAAASNVVDAVEHTPEGDTALYITCVDGASVNIELNEEATAYDTWAVGHGLTGTNAVMSADPDNDGLDNLGEFALGGIPTNGADASALFPTIGKTDAVFEYIHRRRTDAEAAGLTYTVERNTNLLSSTWVTSGISISGTALTEEGFETVTNQISTGEESRQFVRLKISTE